MTALILILWLLAIAAGIFMYFLPTIIASRRKVANMTGVTLVNVLTGWTFLGWLAALIMACVLPRRMPGMYPPQRMMTGPYPQIPPPRPDNRGPGSWNRAPYPQTGWPPASNRPAYPPLPDARPAIGPGHPHGSYPAPRPPA